MLLFMLMSRLIFVHALFMFMLMLMLMFMLMSCHVCSCILICSCFFACSALLLPRSSLVCSSLATDAAVNCTDVSMCKQSTSGCRGTSARASSSPRRRPQQPSEAAASTLGCAANLTGPFCQLCDRNSSDGHVHYVAATEAAVATCKPCGETLGPTIALIAAGAAATIVTSIVVALLLYAVYSHLPDQRKKQLHHTWKIFHLDVKLKVVSDASNAVAAALSLGRCVPSHVRRSQWSSIRSRRWLIPSMRWSFH